MPRTDHRAEFDDDTPIRRRSRKSGFWTPVTISLFAGGGILLVGVAAFLLLRGSPAAVQAGADNWDLRDLTDHLKAKGLEFSTRYSGLTSKGWPSISLESPKYQNREGRPLSVYVIRCPDLEAARLDASADEDGFTFGRFSFGGGPKAFMTEVRAALDR